MNIPKYKFFQSELKDWEIGRYSNGKEVTPTFSTPEVKDGIDRITKELEARGYKRMRNTSGSCISFSKPEYCMSAYIGTFLNTFTSKHSVQLYADHFSTSYKYISVSEVFRHNGTNSNVSIRISVCCKNAKNPPSYHINHDGETFVFEGNGMIDEKEIRKFKPNVSDKVLTNILDKAEEIIEKVQINDPSIWEKDPKDYPKSTEKEYRLSMRK